MILLITMMKNKVNLFNQVNQGSKSFPRLERGNDQSQNHRLDGLTDSTDSVDSKKIREILKSA